MDNKLDIKEVEQKIIEYWKINSIYEKLKEENKKRDGKFLFIDGPPYPSAPVPHIGTIWNKVIKDCILRYERLNGKRVYDQPGYDTHGLPIEVATEKKFNIKNKQEIIEKVGIENFVKYCKSFALDNVKAMTENFKNIGVFMDWDNPYLTLDQNYMSNSWLIIKKAHEKGLLKKGVSVLHWCPRCETTLSDYEVSEYKDIEDPSIYVKFKIKGEPNKYLLIWTTTPWTIPSNVFVMINKDYDYADVKVGNEVYVIAKARVESVMKEAGIEKYEILSEYKGEKLLGTKYEHPLKEILSFQKDHEEYHQVVDGGEIVTLDDGTGLVHSAPGHGEEDFTVGTKHGMPVIMLVDDQGKFTEKVGKYKGKYVRDASQEIIQDLKETNSLLHSSKIVHRYPICWRCKTPLILRAIDQWFIKVTEMKNEMLSQIEKVNWVPEWGKTRIGNMVRDLRDWVVSRQRFWGTPLPIWVCSKCGNVTVVGSKDELKRVAVSEVPDDLHRPWIDKVVVKCNKCGAESYRIPDVADVWFDSGVAFYASLGKNWEEVWKEAGPVDLVLEGHDQLRGWFFSLLRAGMILLDRAPYESVLVHGFMLDEQGREMHKSLGNYVEPSVVIEKYGRDILRLWLLKNTTWEDAKFSWTSMDLIKRELQVIWNVFVFASTYMSIDEFDPNNYSIDDVKGWLDTSDLWILSKYNRTLKAVYASMKNYKVHELANAITQFIEEDISRFYLRLARRRAWVEGKDNSKIAMYTVLYNILKGSLIIISVAIPYIAEEIYQRFVVNPKLSISMEDLPKVDETFINDELERSILKVKEIEESGLNARARAGIKLRWPLKKAYVLLNDEGESKNLLKVVDILKSVLNVKDLQFMSMTDYANFSTFKVEPNKSAIGKEFKNMAKKISEYIERNQENVAKDILSNGYHLVNIEGSEFRITKDHVRVSEETKEGYISSKFEGGMIVINKEVSSEEEEEGIIRDIVRRIQFMRKERGMDITDFIEVNIKPPSGRTETILRWKDYIKNEVRATEVKISDTLSDYKAWDIEDEQYLIEIRKVNLS
ncbi:isoleucine--tRNA ligase [Sulfuracidifex tepidarius]|uniref:Isoleucine--tRNA ligase n=1 Tax=Sulfuracidifex tepidarius TaxID=1294262 RepID=A0A510E3R7_9CREN|nr:isoleucine--tRNA ligase [Sulfuracidifex tepidarius]BBG27162.1 Isoleucine--tRNA ligase [Sulfuracidifex tepidarius]